MKRAFLLLILALSVRAEEKPYQWNVILRLDDPIFVEASIDSADGASILDQIAMKPAQKPFGFAHAKDGVAFTIDVQPAEGGEYLATFEAKRGETVLQRDEERIPSGHSGSEEDLISVDVNNAELGDFVETLRTVSGREIIVDSAIGKATVTLHAQDIPWIVALRRAVTPLGIVVHVTNDGAIVLLKAPKA
jgi:hypothetical protein